MKNLWDPRVKINFLILSKGETARLVYTPPLQVGVILKTGVMCPMEKTLGKCSWR